MEPAALEHLGGRVISSNSAQYKMVKLKVQSVSRCALPLHTYAHTATSPLFPPPSANAPPPRVHPERPAKQPVSQQTGWQLGGTKLSTAGTMEAIACARPFCLAAVTPHSSSKNCRNAHRVSGTNRSQLWPFICLYVRTGGQIRLGTTQHIDHHGVLPADRPVCDAGR